MIGSPVFTRCADAAALAGAAADAIAAAARRALALHGEFRLALSGGGTPQAAYAELARRDLPWDRVAVFFSDERCVPPEHADSNYGRARASLLARVAIADDRVHRMRGELPPAQGADDYGDVLRRFAPGRGFDLCLLGLGSDGHCASLFPGSPACAETARAVVATPAPEGIEPPWRLTLTLAAIAQSQEVLFVVGGADKATVVRQLQVGGGDALPAGRVRALGWVRYLLSADAWGG